MSSVREVELKSLEELERLAYEQQREEERLGAKQKLVLDVIKYSYERGHGAVPNYLIKELTGLSQIQVEQMTNTLHKKGLIKRVRRGVWEYKPPVIKLKKGSICKFLTTKNGRPYCPVYETYIEDKNHCFTRFGKLHTEEGKIKQIQYSLCPGFAYQDEPISIKEVKEKVSKWEAKEIGEFRFKYGSIGDPESMQYEVYVRPHLRQVKYRGRKPSIKIGGY